MLLVIPAAGPLQRLQNILALCIPLEAVSALGQIGSISGDDPAGWGAVAFLQEREAKAVIAGGEMRIEPTTVAAHHGGNTERRHPFKDGNNGVLSIAAEKLFDVQLHGAVRDRT